MSDTEFGSIVAYRSWVLAEKNYLPVLVSILAPVVWPYRTFEAKCFVDKSHDAPVFDCKCGIYAMKTQYWWKEQRIQKRLKGNWAAGQTLINGEVELFGKIIIHEHGYRAKYAKIHSLNEEVLCSICDREFKLGSGELTFFVNKIPRIPWRGLYPVLYAFCSKCRRRALERYKGAKDNFGQDMTDIHKLSMSAGITYNESYYRIADDIEIKKLYEGVRDLYLDN